MDTLAHGLWAAAAAKSYNLTKHQSNNSALIRVMGSRDDLRKSAAVSPWLAAFWGFFPDLFAFSIPFAWLILGPLFGDSVPRIGPPAPHAPSPAATHWTVQLATLLYNYSHSLFVFFLCLAFIWIIYKRIPWEIGGWFLHILSDIPTHSFAFYPTPFLWPFSEWKFNGIAWATSWFMILNYASLSLLSLLLYIARKRKQKRPPDSPPIP
ncbi:MAG: hypothetical protein WC659_02650 [Patescibacteria group bacterium]